MAFHAPIFSAALIKMVVTALIYTTTVINKTISSY